MSLRLAARKRRVRRARNASTKAAPGQTRELEQRVAALQALCADSERIRAEYTAVRSTLAFQIMERVVWPYVPAALARGLRGFWARTVRRPTPAVVPAARLVTSVDQDLSELLAVGRGSFFHLSGWCYHTRLRIRQLDVLLDGRRSPVRNHGIARIDVLRDQAPHDPNNLSLLSGFWTLVQLDGEPAARRVEIRLLATLEGGERIEAALGSLRLAPGVHAAVRVPPEPSPTAEPLLAICLATYNPPLDLLALQITSLRAQVHRNWICIIGDDRSSDRAFEGIGALVAGDPRFVLHRNGTRMGIYRNFERCLERVPRAAEYVAFCDQDDEWQPEKLSRCLAAFDAETQLVYCDMEVVARDGRRISGTYWESRRNNYASLETLLFANTVTGAASLFRASLLRDILPFPKQVGDAYHDHWVASVALTRGRIGYVDQALYKYRQHSSNAYGFRRLERHRLLPQARHVWRWLRRPDEIAGALRDLDAVYYSYLVRLVLIARTLLLRMPDAATSKTDALRRVARIESSLPAIAAQGLAYKLFRRPTLGYEWFCLQAALAHRSLNLWYRLHRPWSMATPASPADTTPAPSAVGMVALLRQMTAPLRLATRESVPSRVNLLMATIDFRYVFGGYIAMFQLAKHLASMGYRVRIVIVEQCNYDPVAWRRDVAAYPGLDGLFDSVETAYVFDRGRALEVNPKDTFIATSCWTAHIAHQAARELGHPRFVFFAQEYEPMFFPMGSHHALSQQSYELPQFTVFSTDWLRDYFKANRLGMYGQEPAAAEDDSVCFRNAVNAFDVLEDDLARRGRRRVLFYARPEAHASRNLFEVGVLGLAAAIRAGRFEPGQWDFDGIGSIGSMNPVDLGGGFQLRLLPKVSLQEYVALLPTYDVGLSLMLTPHPSLTPIDMAAAGLVTVTNTYANKTCEAWATVSPNIIAVRPTVEAIRDGLIEARQRVDDHRARVAGAKVNWPTSWGESFDSRLTGALRRFIEASGGG